MQITPTPVRMDTPLALSREGDCLIFNGHAVNLAKGETCDWIVGQPTHGPGGWEVTIILPHAVDAPKATRFPEPITVKGDGPVDLPPWGSIDSADLAAIREMLEDMGGDPVAQLPALRADAYGATGALPIDHADA